MSRDAYGTKLELDSDRIPAIGQQDGESASGRRRTDLATRLTRSEPRAIWGNIGVTATAQAAVIVSGLLVYRALSLQKGTEAFAVYVLVKNAVQILYAVTMLGMTQALPRTIAMNQERTPAKANTYLAGASLICAGPLLVVVLAAVAAPHDTANLFFGHTGNSRLVVALIATLAASMAFRIFYGFFRGQLRFVSASVVEIVGVAALPLVLVLALPYSVSTLMILMAIGLGLLSIVGLLPSLLAGFRDGRADLPRASAELFRYGWRRVPGDAASIALLALPPVITAHVAGAHDLAYVNTGTLVFVTLSGVLFPVSLVMLPTLTRVWAADSARARSIVGQLAYFSTHLAIFATPQIVLFVGVLAEGWLGAKFKAGETLLQVMVIPAGLYVGLLVIRSTVDAVAVQSYGTRAAAVALAVFVAASAVSLSLDLASPSMCVAASFAAAMSCFGLILFYYVHRLFSLRLADYSLVPALLLGALMAGLAAPVRAWIGNTAISPGTILLVLVLEVALAAVYTAGLWRVGVAWPREILRRGSGGRGHDS